VFLRTEICTLMCLLLHVHVHLISYTFTSARIYTWPYLTLDYTCNGLQEKKSEWQKINLFLVLLLYNNVEKIINRASHDKKNKKLLFFEKIFYLNSQVFIIYIYMCVCVCVYIYIVCIFYCMYIYIYISVSYISTHLDRNWVNTKFDD